MDAHETTCTYNIAETCSASLSLSSLLSLSPSASPIDPLSLLSPSTVQNYGHIRGDPALLGNLASFYDEDAVAYAEALAANDNHHDDDDDDADDDNNNDKNERHAATTTTTKSDAKSPPRPRPRPQTQPLPPTNILTTPGAIAANFLVLYALLHPGDHVICQHPTYQQLYAVPAALGADVELWRARAEDGWVPQFGELEGMVRAETRMVVLNNPNNPTGAALPATLLTRIVDLAQKHSLIVLSDEVYRPLFHSLPPTTPPPPSILSLNHPYENLLATGSLSKAFSLAGIRTGWIASRSRELTERLAAARDYTCISVSRVDQAIAAFALSGEVRPRLLARNVELARRNLQVLDRFVEKYKGVCEFVRPVAGTTAFLRFRCRGTGEVEGRPVDAVAFCKMLLEQTGVLFLPGDKGFGKEFEGYVRIGYVPEEEVVREGFKALEGFMEHGFEKVPPSG